MKSLKIALVIVVVLAIGVGVFFWIQSIRQPEKVKAPENQFTLKIEQEIRQLNTKTDDEFCKNFYNEIAYHIDDFYKQNRFGSNQLENNQWKVDLEKNLYATYAEKFIKQVKTVFLGLEWNPEDLRFIQAEKNELKRSMQLVAGSPVDLEFTSIQTTLNKYNEIVSFISSCNNFNYSETQLVGRFPIVDVQGKISRAAILVRNGLENEYVNNCIRLHNALKGVQQTLFRKHIRYLDNKINFWSNQYSNYNSHKDYSQNLFAPLNAEIDAMGNSIYNVSNCKSESDRLSEKWSEDNVKAYEYFKNKIK